MNNSNINHRRFGRQIHIFHFQIIDAVRISSHEQHCWKQDFQGVSFVKTDEDFQEIFRVISAHRMAFECKDNLCRIIFLC